LLGLKRENSGRYDCRLLRLFDLKYLKKVPEIANAYFALFLTSRNPFFAILGLDK